MDLSCGILGSSLGHRLLSGLHHIGSAAPCTPGILVPRLEVELSYSALKGRFSTTGPSGKPQESFLNV